MDRRGELLEVIRTGQRDLVDAGVVQGILYEEAGDVDVRVTLASEL